MSNHLFFLRHGFDVRIHAFVLMANHFHLLVSTPRANLSQAMCYFMRNTSLDITKAGKRINQTYGSRHFRCIIDNDHYFTHCYKYIYRNPIRAGVVQQVEDYRFSTLHGLLGKSPLIIPLEEDRLLFGNINETMLWLNTPPDQKNEVAVKNAMRLGRFKLCENTANRKPHLLETEKF